MALVFESQYSWLLSLICEWQQALSAACPDGFHVRICGEHAQRQEPRERLEKVLGTGLEAFASLITSDFVPRILGTIIDARSDIQPYKQIAFHRCKERSNHL